MRIARRRRSPPDQSRVLADELAAFAERQGVQGRVCGPKCGFTCQRCGASNCQCMCAPDCPRAPAALSSDPAFPIEPGVAPLVYEMKRTGVFEPCYSCEGHPAPDGAVWKRPTVWFYCESQAPLRLLADGLGKMRYAGALKTPWRVGVTFSDRDNIETTFAIEPDPSEAVTLCSLQEDVKAIARSFSWILADEARALQAVLR
jgi:hypothetical protein